MSFRNVIVIILKYKILCAKIWQLFNTLSCNWMKYEALKCCIIFSYLLIYNYLYWLCIMLICFPNFPLFWHFTSICGYALGGSLFNLVQWLLSIAYLAIELCSYKNTFTYKSFSVFYVSVIVKCNTTSYNFNLIPAYVNIKSFNFYIYIVIV